MYTCKRNNTTKNLYAYTIFKNFIKNDDKRREKTLKSLKFHFKISFPTKRETVGKSLLFFMHLSLFLLTNIPWQGGEDQRLGWMIVYNSAGRSVLIIGEYIGEKEEVSNSIITIHLVFGTISFHIWFSFSCTFSIRSHKNFPVCARLLCCHYSKFSIFANSGHICFHRNS